MTETETIEQAIESWIDSGLRRMGEIVIQRNSKGNGFVVCHHGDIETAEKTPGDLETFTDPRDARTLAQFDASGEYRPLKTAPTLRRGWLLELAGTPALREALDYLYPAMTGAWRRYGQSRLGPVPLRQTLERQTGMYRFARTITDQAAEEIVGRVCRSDGGCLKKILWDLAPGQPFKGLPAEKTNPESKADGPQTGRIPLLCAEACTFVVSAARQAAREAFDQAGNA